MHRDIVKQFNIPFVDNLRVFDSLPNLNNYLSEPSDRWHPNERGCKIIAENIYQCIIDNDLIK